MLSTSKTASLFRVEKLIKSLKPILSPAPNNRYNHHCITQEPSKQNNTSDCNLYIGDCVHFTREVQIYSIELNPFQLFNYLSYLNRWSPSRFRFLIFLMSFRFDALFYRYDLFSIRGIPGRFVKILEKISLESKEKIVTF